MINELLQAVEPFLTAAREALPQVVPENQSLGVEGFNHLPAMEVENRVIVPTNTHLRDIVRTGTMSFSSGGSGWTSFDLGVLAENSHSNGEEVTQPNLQNAPANPVEAVLPEPDMGSVKGVIKNRLLVHRRNPSVSDSEIDRIVYLKNEILNRMFELDHDAFWNAHRNRLIRDYIVPPHGAEYGIRVLESKLDSLFGENPTSSIIYKQLIRSRDSFYMDAPFRGPRGT
jgi:hypothetical protein